MTRSNFSWRKALHAGPVGHVQFHKAEIGVAGEAPLRRFSLEADLVIVVEIVEADHLVAPGQKAQGGGHADKPGGAGDEDFHERVPAGR